MSKAQFTPSAVILALAGDKAAGVQAAFDALQFGLLQIIAHGNNRTLSDTLSALAGLKGAQAKRVQACVQEAYEAGMLEKNAGKTMPDKGAALAAALTDAARMAYDTECTSDAAIRAAKTAAGKAAKEKAAKAAEATAKQAAHDAQPKPLTLADCVAFFRAALAAGDVDAGLHLDALVSDFYVETAPADVIDVQAREVSQTLALAH